LDKRLGGTQGRSEHWSRQNSCPCYESNTDHPASSLSLYRLRYPGSLIITITLITGNNDDNDDDDDDDDGGGGGGGLNTYLWK
jgi:hypothetical protein